MNKNIEIDLFGEHIFVEAAVINDAYAVFKKKNLFCIAQYTWAWELEMVIDESYMPLILEAIEGLGCKSLRITQLENELQCEKEHGWDLELMIDNLGQ